MLVVLNHSFQAVDPWVEDVSVQSEAVRSPLSVRRDGATEAVQGNLFVAIVVLKNISNISDSRQILVSIWVEIVQRAGVVRWTV